MSWIVLLVAIAFMFAVAYALYTRTGSGINPRHDEDKTREAEESDELEPQLEGEADEFETHGTK